jgi:signal transduction histidine kinase
MPRLLHIEDDPVNRLLVRKLLAPVGIEVIDAADGLEGIRLARQTRPDLVLVDIAIPGLDGYEVTLRLRSEPSLRRVPVVAITAEGSRDTSLAVGCDGFLQKPIDARSFVDTVQGYLRGRRERASPERTGKHLMAQSQKIVGHLEEKIAQLSSANERLLELDLARKQFYRTISHELSTPMTPIVGYAKLLRDEELGPLSAPQKKALDAMSDCISRLRGLIDNLLDVTGLETGRMQFVHRAYDMSDVVRRAVERKLERLRQGERVVVTEVPRGPLVGHGDAERLARAVDHLLDNAAKFTPARGMIGVRLRGTPAGQFELCVMDTGPGVSSEARDRLFEPFFQVDGSPTRAHGGAGVGLAIVKGVARGHAGSIDLRSPANEQLSGQLFSGAAFYLRVEQRVTRNANP